MDNQSRISAVVNTRNAAKSLEQTLVSLQGFDEIVVCDMESIDETVEIAERHGCRIISFPSSKGNIVEVAREFAIHQAKNDWVLVVDADEQVSEELADELHRLVLEDGNSGYLIPRKNKFLGMYERGWRKDFQLRFFRQSQTHWPAVIHTKPIVEGQIGKITAKGAELIHLQDRTIAEFIKAYNVYTDHEVKKRKGKNYGLLSLLLRPLFSAFKYFFLRCGFKNGKRGVLHAVIIGMYDIFMVAKIIETDIVENEKRSQTIDN